MGLAGVPPRVAPAGAGDRSAHVHRLGCAAGSLGRVQHPRLARCQVRHGRHADPLRRSGSPRTELPGRLRPGPTGHRGRDRAPQRDHPGPDPAGRGAGPGPARPVRRHDAASGIGPVSGRGRGGRGDRRGGRPDAAARRRATDTGRPDVVGGRCGREPARSERGVRFGVPGRGRPAGVGDDPQHGTTVPNHRGSEEHRRGHRDPRRRRTDRRRDVRVRSGSPGDVPGLLGRRIRVHHDGSAPDATVRHARRDRGNGTARPSGHACRRRLGRHRRCGVRHGGRCRIVDSGDPSAGTGRGASHRSVQPALVADRRVPAAGRGHRHRGRLVARAGGCPHPDHPGPLPAPAAPTAGPPLGRPWPAPHGRRCGLPAVGFGQRGTRRGR